MKMVVGYDRDLACACFKRNLIQLIRPGSGVSDISCGEIDYVSDWLADSSVFGNYRRLGTTWIANDSSELERLAKIPAARLSRSEAWQIETGANNTLTVAGLIERDGATNRSADEGWIDADRRRIKLAMRLYLSAARSRFPNQVQRQVLSAMAWHTPDWIRYLSHLPGNDLMDLLAGGSSSRFDA